VYPETDQYILRIHLILFLEDQIQYHRPISACIFPVNSFPQILPPKFSFPLSSPQTLQIPSPHLIFLPLTKCIIVWSNTDHEGFQYSVSRTSNKITADADTQTEHNQKPHVHVPSSTCRYTVLCYKVLPLYTGRFILNRRTVLHLYSFIFIQYIWS